MNTKKKRDPRLFLRSHVDCRAEPWKEKIRSRFEMVLQSSKIELMLLLLLLLLLLLHVAACCCMLLHVAAAATAAQLVLLMLLLLLLLTLTQPTAHHVSCCFAPSHIVISQFPKPPSPFFLLNMIFFWLVVWNIFYFFIYWEVHHPN